MKNWFRLIMILTVVVVAFVILLFVGCAARSEIAELTAGTTSTTSPGISVDPIVDETTTTSTTTTTTITSTTLYSAVGVLDTSFSGDGIYTYSEATVNQGAKCVIDGVGKIYVVGATASDRADSNTYDFAVWSLNEDGSVNNFFSGDGFYSNHIADQYDSGRAIKIDNSGRLVLAGTYTVAGNYNGFLLRLNSAGVLDEDFGVAGIVTLGAAGSDGIEDLIVDSSEKITLTGYYNNKLAVIRYLADGLALDTNFSDDGVAFYNSIATSWGRRLIINSTGSIFVAGQTGVPAVPAVLPAHNDIVVAKFDNVGGLDTDFGSGGIFIYNKADKNDYGWGIALDGINVLYVGHGQKANSYYNTMLGRLAPRGDPDIVFNHTGVSSLNSEGTETHAYAHFVGKDNQGKIVIVGSAAGQVLVARYNSDGTLDTSFGSGGVFTRALSSNAKAYDAAFDGQGRIVVTGYTDNLAEMFVMRIK